MIEIDIKGLIEKLNPITKASLEGAAALAMSNGQYNIEVEHWLLKIIEHPHTDLLSILEKYEIQKEAFIKQLQYSTSEFKTGNTRPPAFSETIQKLLTQSWLLSSSEFEHNSISSGHLITALVLDSTLSAQVRYTVPELQKIKPESIKTEAAAIIGNTTESALAGRKPSQTANLQTAVGSALEKFTTDLTAKARDGGIDDVIGRDQEIHQLMDILLRRRQNNPILTGEAGVGKTAVVEGFAKKVTDGQVPDSLKNIRLLSLDLGLLEAGASVKGEFENRLKNVIKEIKESPDSIVLFIDEAHSLVGAGGREGQGDAANLMKPALARGELRTIAATTWAEYKKYFEKDPALTRRFQVVKVEEPSIDTAIDMMRAIAEPLSTHHKVRVMDEAIEAAVKLSSRYIPARQLPDKAVSLLDTACAKVSLSQSSVPGSIDVLRNRIAVLERNQVLLEDEDRAIGGVKERISEISASIEKQQNELEVQEKQWEGEKDLCEQLKVLADKFSDNPEDQQLFDQMTGIREELAKVQGSNPLIYPEVTYNTVADVVSSWTGIPVGKMVSNEINNVLGLSELLQERVKGQNHSLNAIAESINIARAGLTDPRKPLGVFLLIGPSGTGKTETALSLAEAMYGGEQNLITINMSEFKEEHKVSMLLGAPAGYVGYGEGGVLTEAVRRKPYSVVLLDEMEKAHSGIQDIFYNLFDKGTIKDGEGRDIDFKNTIIIMTSNACSGAIAKICESNSNVLPEEITEQVRPELLEHFRPAFLGRTKVIPYYSLDKDVLNKIVDININRIRQRVANQYKANLACTDGLRDHIVSCCNDPDTGARNVENIVERSILPVLAKQCLNCLADEKEINQISLGLESGKINIEID